MIYKEKPENFNPKMEVVSCFLEHHNEFLLLHRQDHKSEGNKWGVPAGKIEKGESLKAGLMREVKEEVGIIILESQLNYWGKIYIRYPEYDFMYHMFSTQLSSRPVVWLNLEEHKDFAWVSPKDSLHMNLVLDEDNSIKLFYGLE